jgi:peptide/nickel transport system substrate-binding protein
MFTPENIPREKGLSMRSKLVWALMPALIAALAFALSSCGGSSSTSSSATQSQFVAPTAPPDNAQKGGTLNVIAAGDVDYTDPGAEYYVFSYMIAGATQRPLFSWQPDDVEQPTPDLASGEAQVSSDLKTVTVPIQTGIKYSPPVNRDVTSADVKYAIERGLLPGVANGYEEAYFSDIVGFKQAQAAAAKDPTKAPNLSGITTPDPQTIVFKLDRPVAKTFFVQALSLPLSAPVPEDYAKKFDAQNPSGYGTHVVATGPYMIENDSSGALTGYSAGKEIKLVRNPNWDSSKDWRPAYVDSINVQEGFADTVSASKKILTGSDEINGDFGLPAESLKLAATKYPSQLALAPPVGERYVALNTAKPPFDDINVRKAVIANSDREALRATRGGALIGNVETHFLPPSLPGFDQAGGVAGPQGSEFDFVQNPKGDPALAASYMKKAGFSSGKCEGSCDITMVGDNSPPGSDTAQVAKSQLEELGFHVSLQQVAHDLMYTKFCSVPKNAPNVCPNVGWVPDFFDPQPMLDPTFNGKNILSSNNSNWSQLNVKSINDAMAKAELISDPNERAAAWAKIDDDITAQAPAIPWVWDAEANVQSKDVAGVMNDFNTVWDLSFTSLTK